MKTKTSVMKKTASVVAGGALLASLYANAVLVPQGEQAMTRKVATQIQALESGDAEFIAEANGFTVVELAPQQDTEIRQLTKEIAKLQAEIEEQKTFVGVEVAKIEAVRAAYQPEEVARTAQANSANAFAALSGAANQISAISGLPIGATIGSLSSIAADPLLAAGAIEVIIASTQPGGISSAISVGGGLSAQATAVLALLGVQNVGGIGGGSSASNGGGLAGANGSTGAGSSTGGAISV
ncbi:MAG: hypothetical protein ACPGVU_08130 [Limisphaerales bacterium]|jgi:hypothetical protein